MSPSNARVGVNIALNLVSAISIVFLNKSIFVSYGFPSMTLTLVHFVMTSLGLQICVWFNVFSPKRLFVFKILPLAVSFCGFVVLTNLSLQSNTVGTYQLAKAMTTPTILFIQATFYNKRASAKIKLAVVTFWSVLGLDSCPSKIDCSVYKSLMLSLCIRVVLVVMLGGMPILLNITTVLEPYQYWLYYTYRPALIGAYSTESVATISPLSPEDSQPSRAS